jgi:hypothetical protein
MSQILSLQKLQTSDLTPTLSLSITSCDSNSCHGGEE